MSIFDIDYKEVVYNLYKEYSDEIINLLVYEGILYEFDCGFGGKAMIKECEYIESHLRDDGFDVHLDTGIYPRGNIGNNMPYIYNTDMLSRNEAYKKARRTFTQRIKYKLFEETTNRQNGYLKMDKYRVELTQLGLNFVSVCC